jgi:two-component system, OmpR family, phosphate regulon response regulator PhoB
MTVRGKTILIADDEEDLRLLVQVTLEHPSYEILTAVDGLSALQAIQNRQPDLVILDWMMPGLNGCQVVDALRQDPGTAMIPVVMLTAKDGVLDGESLPRLNLAGFLVKPFSPLELIQTVRKVLA